MSERWPGGIVSGTENVPKTTFPQCSGVWTMEQAAYWIAQGQWPYGPADSNFENVTLLLNGDGTNGGQNNTFVDSSTNNFTITRNGNTTQGSFSPYGSNWSNYFDGNGDYFNVSSISSATGDFTFSFWMFATGFGTQGNGTVVGASSGSNIFSLQTDSTTPARILGYVGVATGAGNLSPTLSQSVLNRWIYIVIVRSGSTITFYENGTSVATATNSNTINFNSGFQIGSYVSQYNFEGYLSDIKLVIGTANVPSGVPTAPSIDTTNTQLLTCQSNRFIDNSSSPKTLTVNGSPSVQRFSPFEPSAPYSTSIIGGSGYFDGSGDYLSVASNAAFGYGTEDFSIEFWVNPNSVAASNRCVFHTDDSCNLELTENATMRFFAFGNAYTGGTYTGNNWIHCCVTRVNGTARMFFNGVLVNNFSLTGNKGNSAVQIGANAGSNQFLNGYLSNVRIVKGGIPSAYSTSSTTNGTSIFIPPTAPFTGNESLTGGSLSLLLNCTNAAIPDYAMQNDLETVGNAQISTSVVKYGSGSLAFDGTGDYLRVPYSKAFAFAGDFTVEFWINYSAHETFGGLVACASSTNPTTGWQLIFNNAADTLLFQASSSFSITTSTALPRNQWNHVAVARNGSSVVIYINGLVAGSGTSSSVFDSGSFPLYVAAERTPLFSFTGYMDDLRITNGIARYVQPFTPPTAALPTY